VKTKTYKFISTPGHGYLEVPLKDIHSLGIADKISGCSYLGWDKAYLEEDCDAGVFIEALKATGVEFKSRTEYVDSPRFKDKGANFLPNLLDDFDIGSEVKLIVNNSIEPYVIEAFKGQEVILCDKGRIRRLRTTKIEFRDVVIPKEMEERINRLQKKALEIANLLSEKAGLEESVPKLSYSRVTLEYPHFKLYVSDTIRLDFGFAQYEAPEENLGVAINYDIALAIADRFGHDYIAKLHYLKKKTNLEDFASEFLPYVQVTGLSKEQVVEANKIVREILGRREVFNLSERDIHVRFVATSNDINEILENLDLRLRTELGINNPQVSIEFP
jgi:ribosomal protein L21E